LNFRLQNYIYFFICKYFFQKKSFCDKQKIILFAFLCQNVFTIEQRICINSHINISNFLFVKRNSIGLNGFATFAF